jgi:hypothetical protein
MSEGPDSAPLLMASLVSVATPVEYEANLVSYFDYGHVSFGERSFYWCFRVYRPCLVINLTPSQASPVRKSAQALK